MQMAEPTPNTFSFFNNSRLNNGGSSITDDRYKVFGYANDPSLATSRGVYQKVLEVLQPFRDLFRAKLGRQFPDAERGMHRFFELTNLFSMKSYVSQVLRMSQGYWLVRDPRQGYRPVRSGSHRKHVVEYLRGSLVVTWGYHSRPREPSPRLAHRATPGPRAGGSYPNWPWFDLEYTFAASEQRTCYSNTARLQRRILNPASGILDSLSQSAQETIQFQSPVTAISENVENN